MTKHNRYTVAYYQPQCSEHIEYGYILKFVTHPPNTDPENEDHMVLLQLHTQPSTNLKNLSVEIPLIRPYTTTVFSDFSSFECGDKIVAIRAEDIIMKCFNTSTYEQLEMTSFVCNKYRRHPKLK